MDTAPGARGLLRPSFSGCGPNCGGFQLPCGWQDLVVCSKAVEDPHLEGQCLHVSLHLPPGDGIPWDSLGYLSQIPLQKHSSDAPLLSALDPKAASRLHSLFITASLFPVPHLFTKQRLCSQLTQAVGDPEASSSPWDRSVLPTHPCCREVAMATGKSRDLQPPSAGRCIISGWSSEGAQRC